MRRSNDDHAAEDRRDASAVMRADNPTSRNAALDLARNFAAPDLRVTLCWQVARMLLRIGFCGALAVFAGRLIEAGTFEAIALAAALAGLALSSVAGCFADLAAARAEDSVVNRLRAALQEALAQKSPARIRAKPAGALVAGLQRYPTALAGLVVSLSAARSMLGLGPLLAAAAVACVSWPAALALLLAVPIMIVFFVILGVVIRDKAEAQEKAFGRLAAQFSDRIRTLPTILANHALPRERGKIERRMARYADSTMGVLKVAFVNAGINDFFSALAIAVLAVFLGLGHLGLAQVPGFSGLALWQSLFILMIAAEFFTPFRRYAEQYHVKAEGEAAAKELDWYFDQSDAAAGEVAAELVAGVFDVADLPPAGLVVISGPSGSGKSTLLRRLAGIETPSCDHEALPRVRSGGCDWIATDIYVPAGTLAEAIGFHRDVPDRATLQLAASHVGLLDETLLPGGLKARISEGGDNLSGGQRMRIGIARGMLSNAAVIADEPTAKLDPETANLVRQVVTEMAARRLVVVATHDPQLIAAASRHYILQPQPQAKQTVAA